MAKSMSDGLLSFPIIIVMGFAILYPFSVAYDYIIEFYTLMLTKVRLWVIPINVTLLVLLIVPWAKVRQVYRYEIALTDEERKYYHIPIWHYAVYVVLLIITLIPLVFVCNAWFGSWATYEYQNTVWFGLDRLWDNSEWRWIVPLVSFVFSVKWSRKILKKQYSPSYE
ncbi:hypothetical protein [Vibrio japonicus]|uniref:Uncharacterized protein n=1 Tax=Vibrio japonicus TaxID=1824638 RepID=A0ABY5LKV4_9VIBR|nr:hypothetical protein [Vibrio japonicus]UUM31478.1 hypothetical protein NP165_04935 [Vibrio japonicus]